MNLYPNRRSIRLPYYDYSNPGMYFVTICSFGRECLFGNIINGQMQLNNTGEILQKIWHELPERFPNIELDQWVIMPNHVHGIIHILDNPVRGAGSPRPCGPGPCGFHRPCTDKLKNSIPLDIQTTAGAGTAPLRVTLGQMIAYFKYKSTKRINLLRQTPAVPVWHRNYYEHVIRNEKSLNEIREYILNNTMNWTMDENHP